MSDILTITTETITPVMEEIKSKPVIVSDFKKEIITKNREKIRIYLKDLFDITEDCKFMINYETLPDDVKYKIEKYQDSILYYAQNFDVK